MIPFCRVNWPPALGLREKAAKGLQQKIVLVTINWKPEKFKTGEIQLKKFATAVLTQSCQILVELSEVKWDKVGYPFPNFQKAQTPSKAKLTSHQQNYPVHRRLPDDLVNDILASEILGQNKKQQVL